MPPNCIYCKIVKMVNFMFGFVSLAFPVSVICKQMLKYIKEPRHLKVPHKESYFNASHRLSYV